MRPSLYTLGVLLTSVATACSEETRPDEPETHTQVPPRPEGAEAGDGSGTMFAVTKYFIGSTTRDGVASIDAWQAYGYDRDDAITKDHFEGHCAVFGAASPPEVFEDGPGGIDNGFGHHIVPIFSFLSGGGFGDDPDPEPQNETNAKLGAGTSALVFYLRDLGPAERYDPIDAFVYEGTGAVDGEWLLRAESVANPSAATLDEVLVSGLTHFAKSYVNDGVWVGLEEPGEDRVLTVTWTIAGAPLELRIHHAVVVMELPRTEGDAATGTVSGIVDAEELREDMRSFVVEVFDEDLCTGSAVDSLLNQVRQQADIMRDGIQDPDQVCDGLSIGFGFEARPAVVRGVAEPAAPPPDLCAPMP
ncbi:MAG: hypothetical protein HOW73_07220 [Polyangiaceae bacterium]|nr:hypothetical protein [Polyangiaceae bacterium]